MSTNDMIKESFDSYNYVHTPRRRKTRVKTSGYTIRPTTDNSYIAQLQRAPKRHITNDIYAVTLHKNHPYVTIYDVRNNLEPHGITNIQYVGQDRGNLHILVKLPSHA